MSNGLLSTKEAAEMVRYDASNGFAYPRKTGRLKGIIQKGYNGRDCLFFHIDDLKKFVGLDKMKRNGSKMPMPKSRAECRGKVGICVKIGCEYHMFNPEVAPSSLWRLSNNEIVDMLINLEEDESCVLDIIESKDGGQHIDKNELINYENSLNRIGRIWGITRERVRQIEKKGVEKIQESRRRIEMLQPYVGGLMLALVVIGIWGFVV